MTDIMEKEDKKDLKKQIILEIVLTEPKLQKEILRVLPISHLIKFKNDLAECTNDIVKEEIITNILRNVSNIKMNVGRWKH